MSEIARPRRSYTAPAREQASRKTRRRIRHEAESLFVEHGFAGTTMDAIASRAGVTKRFVHIAFGSKAMLFSEVIRVAVAGDDEPIPLRNRPQWVVALEAAGAGSLAPFAEVSATIMQRTAALLDIADSAAAVDEGIAMLRDRARNRRHLDCSTIIEAMREGGVLTEAFTVEHATDVIYTLAGPANYLLLVRERGWSLAQYAGWLSTATSALLLRPTRP
jgi:AcrR family transcriptional regulator